MNFIFELLLFLNNICRLISCALFVQSYVTNFDFDFYWFYEKNFT